MRKLQPDELIEDLESFLQAVKGKVDRSGVDRTVAKALEWWPELRPHALLVEMWAHYIWEEANPIPVPALKPRRELQRKQKELLALRLERDIAEAEYQAEVRRILGSR
jgi:hypothetical protein